MYFRKIVTQEHCDKNKSEQLWCLSVWSRFTCSDIEWCFLEVLCGKQIMTSVCNIPLLLEKKISKYIEKIWVADLQT